MGHLLWSSWEAFESVCTGSSYFGVRPAERKRPADLRRVRKLAERVHASIDYSRILCLMWTILWFENRQRLWNIFHRFPIGPQSTLFDLVWTIWFSYAWQLSRYVLLLSSRIFGSLWRKPQFSSIEVSLSALKSACSPSNAAWPVSLFYCRLQ